MKTTRIISLVMTIVLLASLFAGFAGTASADDVITHTVQNGEYLYQICKNHGLDYYACKQAIMILNGFTSEVQCNRIQVGQPIELPISNAVAATVKGTVTTSSTVSSSVTVNGVTTTTTSSNTMAGNASGYQVAFYLVSHVMQPGQTLTSACNLYGTVYDQYKSIILGINNISSPNNVQAQKQVFLPASKVYTNTCYAVIQHTVSSGETWTSICRKYGTDYIANKVLVNGLNNGNVNTIYVNQKVLVPVIYSTSSPVTPGTPTQLAVVATGYSIKFNAATNGNPYAVVGSAKVDKAEQYTTVSVIPNPASDYTMKSIKVVRSDNKADVMVDGNTFTMPECDVIITVTYTKGLKISKISSVNGDFYAMVNGESVTSCNYGDKVTLEFSPKSGYSVKDVTYTKKNTSTTTTVSSDGKGTYSFLMPNYNIDLKVTFEQTVYRSLTYTATGYGSVIFYDKNEKKVTKAIKGTEIWAVAEPDSEWVLRQGTFKIDSGTVTNQKQLDEDVWYFVVGDNDVRMDAAFDNTKQYKISADGDYAKAVSFMVNGVYTNVAKSGDVVTVVAYPENGYAFNAVATGNHITSGSKKITPTTTSPNLTFKMPDGQVRIVPTFDYVGKTAVYHGAFIEDKILKHSSAIGEGLFEQGKTVTLTFNTDVNYRLIGLTVLGLKESDIIGSNVEVEPYGEYCYIIPKSDGIDNIVFKMPNNDVSVVEAYYEENCNTATFKGVNVVGDVEGIDCGMVSCTDGAEIRNGDTVIIGTYMYLWYSLDDGYDIESVIVDIKDGSTTISSKQIFPDKEGYFYEVKESDKGYDIYVKIEVSKEMEMCSVTHSEPQKGGSYTLAYSGGSFNKSIEVEKGTTVVLCADPADGYTIARVVINNIDVTGEIVDVGDGTYTYTFTAGANDGVDTYVTRVDFKEIVLD